MFGGQAGAHLSLIFDAALALLLIATIGYAVVLNRKLTDLRSAKQEMEQLLAGFAGSTERAEASLKALREAANETGEVLQDGIVKGNAVADDLVFLIERAGPIADRLAATPGRSGAEGAPDLAGGSESEPAAESESALIEALRGVR